MRLTITVNNDKGAPQFNLRLFVTLAILSWFSLSTYLFSQADSMSPTPGASSPTNSSDIDTVSNTNGSLQLHIPLWSIKQRGNLSLSFTLRYNSPGFAKVHECLVPDGNCTDTWNWDGDGVFVTASTDVRLGPVVDMYQNNSNPSTPSYGSNGYYWQVNTPDSGLHKLANTGNGIYRAIDGSGWMYNEATHVLFSQDGVHYAYQPMPPDALGTPQIGYLLYVEDTNGNRITLNYTTVQNETYFSGWTDTLGRNITPPPLGGIYEDLGPVGISWTRSSQYGSCPGGDNNPIIWMPPGGTTPFRFCYTQAAVRTYFFAGKGIPDTPVTGNPLKDTKFEANTGVSGLSSVVLPDGNSWNFQYTPLQGYDGVHNYGELTQVTLPGGGTVGYTWNENFYSACVNSSKLNQTRSQVLTRIVNAQDANGPQTWQYSGNTTIDPLGNKTIHTLSQVAGCAYLETQTDYYNNASNLIKTSKIAYQTLPILDVINTNMRIDARVAGAIPSVIATQWPDGTTKKTTYTYSNTFHASDDEGTLGAFPNGGDFPYGQPTSTVEYGYGPGGSAGAPLRSITTSYLAFQSAAALRQNLLSLPSQITVTDGNTNEADITTYGYDGSSLVSGNATSGWSGSLPSGWIRANQTSVSHNWNTTGANLQSSKTYTDTGLVATSSEPSNPSISGSLTTTYEHGSAYNGAWATKITDPLGHAQSFNYDQNTGALTNATDANSQTTIYTYDDPLQRLTNVSRSAGSHNLASSVTYAYPSSTSVTTTTALNSSIQPEVSTSSFDGVGRISSIRHADPEGDVLTTTTYDQLGRKATETTPYRATSDLTYETVTTSYDAISRVTQTLHSFDQSATNVQYQGAATLTTDASNHTVRTQKVSLVDGLERLIRVCEVSSANPAVGPDTPVGCGISVGTASPQGYVTTYTQSLHGVTQINQGQQTRSFTYDTLGQLTDTHNPEVGSIHYDYDPDGNVQDRTLPMPNAASGASDRVTISYVYDAAHRMQSRIYSTGGFVSFGYDEAQVDGKTLENTIGRLSSESTNQNGQIASKSLYSYDTTGKVAKHYQCVGGSCPANYQSAEYIRDGEEDLTSLSTSQNEYTLAYDSAAHVTSVTSMLPSDPNHSSHFVEAATYAPNGDAAKITLGNSTQETYTYSPRWVTGMQVVGYTSESLPKGQATVAINGGEQVNTQTRPGSQSTGTLTIAGGEQDQITYSPVGCVPIANAVPRNAAATQAIPQPQATPKPCTSSKDNWDTGVISFTSGSQSVQINWNSTSYGPGLATSLASVINGAGMSITALASGSNVILQARNPGAGGNNPISVAYTSTNSKFASNPSFSITGPSSLTGGVDGTSTTTYDSGRLTISVNGSLKIVGYGQGDTGATVASNLTAAINVDSSYPVTASISGTTVALTARLGGSEGNYSLTASQTYDTGHFSSASFIPQLSASSLTGGQDATGQQIPIYTYGLQHASNGQIIQAADSINGTWNYTYDEFNRLSTAGDGAGSFNWNYDRYGNRWKQIVTAGSGFTTSLTFDTTTNRAQDNLSYDAAGNVKTDTLHSYVYDAENRILQVDGGVQYIYDAEGRRVGKSDGTVYVVDTSGAVLDEFNGTTWKRSEVNVGRHLATVTPAGTYFAHMDWLGTERGRTSPTGEICQANASLPYGEQVAGPGLSAGVAACNPSPAFFTGKDRDPETGLDNFGARYLSSHWGRWMSPDWAATPTGVPYAHLESPQSLNLYAYVGNDPVDGEDADGHSTFWYGDGTTNNGDGLAEHYFNEFIDAVEPASGSQRNSPSQTSDPSTGMAQQQSGCNCGTNHHFHTQNQAATAALKAIFPTSEDQLAEYGGRIYMNPDGKTYSYTTPVTQGQNGTVDPDAGQGMGNRLPAGTTSAGEYHTHPDTLAHCCGQEGFSGQDGQRAVNQHIPTYIMAPSGTIYKLDGTHSNNYMTAPQSSWPANGPIP